MPMVTNIKDGILEITGNGELFRLTTGIVIFMDKVLII
jgi:hypothetical protein